MGPVNAGAGDACPPPAEAVPATGGATVVDGALPVAFGVAPVSPGCPGRPGAVGGCGIPPPQAASDPAKTRAAKHETVNRDAFIGSAI
jgi:hypothetical protein